MVTGPASEPPFVEVLKNRRMTRAFTAEALDPADVERVLNAAFRAPSAGNSQGVELLVLTGDGVGDYWTSTLSDARRASFPWPGLLVAPLLIVPYVEPSRYVDRYREADKAHTGLGEGAEAWAVPYWWVDGGAAVENMLLAAEACSLGVCFFGQFEHEAAVRSRFGVPDDRRAVGTLALGHPDPANDRPSASVGRPRRTAVETVHRNRW